MAALITCHPCRIGDCGDCEKGSPPNPHPFPVFGGWRCDCDHMQRRDDLPGVRVLSRPNTPQPEGP
jgi:hypothetical protein